MECILESLKQRLTIDKTTLSSYIRSKTSAYDPRPSSKVIGMSGLAIIIFVVALMVLPDLLRVIRYLMPCDFKEQNLEDTDTDSATPMYYAN